MSNAAKSGSAENHTWQIDSSQAVHVLLPGRSECFYVLLHDACPLKIAVDILEGSDSASMWLKNPYGGEFYFTFTPKNVSYQIDLSKGIYRVNLKADTRTAYRIRIDGADDVWQRTVWLTDRGPAGNSQPIIYLNSSAHGTAEIEIFDCSEGAFLLGISAKHHGVPGVQMAIQPGGIMGDNSKELGGVSRWRPHQFFTADTDGVWLFIPSMINAAGDYALRGNPDSDMGNVEFHWYGSPEQVKERFSNADIMRLAELNLRDGKINGNNRLDIYTDAANRGLNFLKALTKKTKDGYYRTYQRWYADVNTARRVWATEGNMLIARTFYQAFQHTKDPLYKELALGIARKFAQYQILDANNPCYGALVYCLEEELEDIFTTCHDQSHFRDLRKMIGEIWNVEDREVASWGSSFNIQGKILFGLAELVHMANDEKLRSTLKLVADHYACEQYESGPYEGRWPHYAEAKPYSVTGFPACMGVAGLIYAYQIFDDRKYLDSAENALKAFLRDKRSDGSVVSASSHEGGLKIEGIALRSSFSMLTPFALAYKVTKKQEYKEALDGLHSYLTSLQDENGAIKEPQTDCLELYQTQNWGPQGFVLAYEATGDKKFLETGIALTDALIRIQLQDKDPHYDGAWVGSFNVTKNVPGGWIENEGNCTDLYTGWTAATILNGIQKILKHL